MNRESGFTLLEFIIALALLTVLLASTYMIQGTSLFSSVRSKNILIATNLAKNVFSKTEIEVEGVPFEQLSNEEEGSFEEPFKEFTWKRTITEVDFTTLASIMEQYSFNSEEKSSDQNATVTKLFLDYLSKSVRRINITVEWPDGEEKSSLTFTELLVNYEAEFSTGI